MYGIVQEVQTLFWSRWGSSPGSKDACQKLPNSLCDLEQITWVPCICFHIC